MIEGLPVFETDDSTYVLVTLPIHEHTTKLAQDIDQDVQQAIYLSWNSIEELIAFSDQVSDQVSDQLSDQVQVIIKDDVGVYAIDILLMVKIHPCLLEPSQSNKNLCHGPINKLTLVTCLYKPRKKEIILVSVRSTRRKPLK